MGQIPSILFCCYFYNCFLFAFLRFFIKNELKVFTGRKSSRFLKIRLLCAAVKGARSPNITKLFGQGVQSPLLSHINSSGSLLWCFSRFPLFGIWSTGTSQDEIRRNMDTHLMEQKYVWKGCVSLFLNKIFIHFSHLKNRPLAYRQNMTQMSSALGSLVLSTRQNLLLPQDSHNTILVPLAAAFSILPRCGSDCSCAWLLPWTMSSLAADFMYGLVSTRHSAPGATLSSSRAFSHSGSGSLSSTRFRSLKEDREYVSSHSSFGSSGLVITPRRE